MRGAYLSLLSLGVAVFAWSPARAQSLVIDATTGPVTSREVAAFKAFMATQTLPPNSWGTGTEHNALADGPAGNDVEAWGMMYEATQDPQILDQMLSFVDGIVAMRNDLPGGAHRVMWTGNVDPVWPADAPGTPAATYAGGENGDTIAHIEYAALLVLRSPTLWSATVPDHDPHGYGSTYLDRAKTYLARCDEANDQYDAKYFVLPNTNLIRNPTNWPAGFHTMEAINIQMMLDGGFQRNAEAHEILGDAPARVAQYDAIVNASVHECIGGMKHPYAANGHTVTKWYYYPWDVTHVETVGHGAYDIVGIWRAGQRSAYGIAGADLALLGDTLVFGIALGKDSFAQLVDGTGGTQNYMQGQWLLAGDWNRAAYDAIATADIASGRYANDPFTTASILFMKQRLAAGADGGVGPAPDAGSQDAAPPPADAGNAMPDDGGSPSIPPSVSDGGAPPAPRGSSGAGASAPAWPSDSGGCSVGARARANAALALPLATALFLRRRRRCARSVRR
jgi:hypothetical protein